LPCVEMHDSSCCSGIFGWNQGPFELMNLNFRLLLVLPEGGEDRGQAGVERAVQL
jgi:hypothetical protein